MPVTQPTVLEPTRASVINERLKHHNGGCSALKVGGTCACDAWEMTGMKDGFPTCVCTHTRWSHANTFIVGRAAAVVAGE